MRLTFFNWFQRILVFASSMLIALNVSGQKNYRPDTVIDGKTYSWVEKMPTPRYDLGDYLSKKLRYPDSARAKNVEGKVIIKFLVLENGDIDSPRIVQGIGSGCDEEALRVVENMPRWRSGRQKGKPVRVWFDLPIVFRLE